MLEIITSDGRRYSVKPEHLHDTVTSLGLKPEDEDREPGWRVEVAGSTPSDAVSTV